MSKIPGMLALARGLPPQRPANRERPRHSGEIGISRPPEKPRKKPQAQTDPLRRHGRTGYARHDNHDQDTADRVRLHTPFWPQEPESEEQP